MSATLAKSNCTPYSAPIRSTVLMSALTSADGFRQPLETSFEAAGDEQLHQARGRLARIPVGVPLAARLDDIRAGARLHDAIAEQRAHLSREDVGDLVLARVAMQRRREPARRQRMLDDHHPAVGDLGPHLVHRAEVADHDFESVTRPHDRGQVGFPLNGHRVSLHRCQLIQSDCSPFVT